MASYDFPDSSGKIVGIEHPDFILNVGQTYIENVLERQRLNRDKEDTSKLISDFLDVRAKELAQYIEEYALPFAINSYKGGTKSFKFGRVTWEEIVNTTLWYSATPSAIKISIYVERSTHILKTTFATYDLSLDIGKRVKLMFDKVPGITTEVKVPTFVYHGTFLCISFTFPINHIS